MRNKTTLLLLASATAVLFLLSIGVTNLQMLPGQPFSLGELDLTAPPSGGGGTNLSGDFALLMIRGVFLIAALGIPVMLLYAIVSPEGRRQLISGILMIFIVVVACMLFNNMAQQRNARDAQERPAAATEMPTEQATREAPTDVFQADTPEWVVIAASVAVAVLLCGVALGVAYVLWRRRKPAPEAPDPLAEQAQGALDALQAGGDLKETVVRCYHDMSRAVRQERGLRRDADMTPREFEQALQARGMPGEAVRQLTRLFEQVRYGHQHLGNDAEQQAIASLNAILAACHAGRAT